MQKFWDWLGAKLIEWLSRSTTKGSIVAIIVWLLYAFADGLFVNDLWQKPLAQFLAALISGNVGGVVLTRKK